MVTTKSRIKAALRTKLKLPDSMTLEELSISEKVQDYWKKKYEEVEEYQSSDNYEPSEEEPDTEEDDDVVGEETDFEEEDNVDVVGEETDIEEEDNDDVVGEETDIEAEDDNVVVGNKHLETRSSLPKLVHLISKFKEPQKRVVKKMGFGGLLHLKCTSTRRKFISWLIENFDLENRTLKVHGEKLRITAGHVRRLLGLELTGDIVCLKGNDKEVKNARKKVLLKTDKNGKVNLNFLESELETMTESGLRFKMYFGIYLIGAFLCPTSSTKANTQFLHALVHKGKLNWSKYVLDFLIDGIADFKGSQKSCRGCVMLLLFLYCHYFSVSGQVKARPSLDEPAIAYMDDDFIRSRLAVVGKKGYMKAGKGLNIIFHRNEFKRDANTVKYNNIVALSDAVVVLQNQVNRLEGQVSTVADLTTKNNRVVEDSKEIMVSLSHDMRNLVSSFATFAEKEGVKCDGYRSREKGEEKREEVLGSGDTDGKDLGMAAFQTPYKRGKCSSKKRRMDATSCSERKRSKIEKVSTLPENLFSGRMPNFDNLDMLGKVSYILRKRTRKPSIYQRTPYTVAKKINAMQRHISESEMSESVQVCAAKSLKSDMAVVKKNGIAEFLKAKSVGNDLLNFPEFLDEAIYEYITGGQHPGEYMIKFGDLYYMNGFQLVTLAPSQWVCSDVLNMLSLKMTLHLKYKYANGTQPTWYLPITVSENSKDGGKDKKNLKVIVDTYLKEEGYGGSVQACKHIVVPMFIRHHFYLCVINRPEKKAFIVDLMNCRQSTKISQVKRLLKFLDKALEMCDNSYAHDLREVTPEFLLEVAKQDNAYDCGVFVAKHMLMGKVTKPFDVQIDAESDRRYVAAQLFYDPYNELRYDIEGKIIEGARLET